MIWRGKQYVRGIRLYYQKLHHYPTQLDDLYKPKTGIRFMRQAYKDPMNTADGTWRIIYVGQLGQVSGSLTQPTNPLVGGTNPGSVLDGSLSASSSSSFSATKDPFSAPIGTSSLSSSSVAPAACQASSSNSTNSSETPAVPSLQNPQTPQCSNSPQPGAAAPYANAATLQSAIIGVGSKINKNSIRLYGKEKNYLHFEFIWKLVTADPDTVVPNP